MSRRSISPRACWAEYLPTTRVTYPSSPVPCTRNPLSCCPAPSGCPLWAASTLRQPPTTPLLPETKDVCLASSLRTVRAITELSEFQATTPPERDRAAVFTAGSRSKPASSLPTQWSSRDRLACKAMWFPATPSALPTCHLSAQVQPDKLKRKLDLVHRPNSRFLSPGNW